MAKLFLATFVFLFVAGVAGSYANATGNILCVLVAIAAGVAFGLSVFFATTGVYELTLS